VTATQRIASRWFAAGDGCPNTMENAAVIQVICNRNGAEGIIKILSYLKWCGGVGHSCTLKDENLMIGGIDGDGEDCIKSVTLDGETVDKWVEKDHR